VDWLADFAPIFKKVLKPTGSIVLELGNAWEAGRPVMSTLALKALLAFLERGEFTLCQQFVWYNPARLPSPAQWVNVERLRVRLTPLDPESTAEAEANSARVRAIAAA